MTKEDKMDEILLARIATLENKVEELKTKKPKKYRIINVLRGIRKYYRHNEDEVIVFSCIFAALFACAWFTCSTGFATDKFYIDPDGKGSFEIRQVYFLGKDPVITGNCHSIDRCISSLEEDRRNWTKYKKANGNN